MIDRVLWFRLGLLATIVAGAVLRVDWALGVPAIPAYDAAVYVGHAVDLAEGRGYTVNGQPTASWPVGYPAGLALVFWAFGTELLWGRLLNAVFGVVSLACLYRVVFVLAKSRSAAWLATGLAAVSPTQIAYTSLLVTEVQFTCLMMLAAALAVGERVAPARLAVAGLVLGLAAMTRPHGLLLPALIGLLGHSQPWKMRRHGGVRAGVLYVGMALAMTPWWVRNAQVFDAFVPVATNGGTNLLIGNNPEADGSFAWSAEVGRDLRARQGGDGEGGRPEYERSQIAAAIAWNYMRENLGSVVRLWGVKLQKLYEAVSGPRGWNRVVDGGGNRGVAAIGPILEWHYFAVVTLAALGALAFAVRSLPLEHLASRSRPAAWIWRRLPAELPLLPAAVVLSFTAVHLLFFAVPRYHYPMMPWILCYASIFAVCLSKGRATGTRCPNADPISETASQTGGAGVATD